MSDFLDRYTQIDDLLRISIRQQTLTNKLLVALLAGTGQQQVEGVDLLTMAQQLNVKDILQADTYKTTIKNPKNISTTSLTKKLIFEAKYGGTLGEVYFLSDVSNDNNNNYKVKIISDGEVIYEDTWTNFNIRSNYERDMTAFYDDDNYVISFQNIAFNNSLLIEVVGTTVNTVTFHNIYIKIHKKLL